MTSTHVPPITEEDIANFLTNTPGFFERHAEVLASVQITSPHGQRAVSLQERQAEMLREKIKLLEQRIMEMIRHGNENVMLSDKILRWARSLFLTINPAELPVEIVREIKAKLINATPLATHTAHVPHTVHAPHPQRPHLPDGMHLVDTQA